MAPQPLLLTTLAAALLGAAHQEQAEEPAGDARAVALFREHCASCHGETGDGQGWAQLDRPARSFQDGGFSYGNTPEAIFRTLTFGIPGTPMPAFDASLDEDQRRLLADHVVALGPPGTQVEPEDTVLAVGARPRVLRGLLPIASGAGEHPRGLLIGMPSGHTFEYRTDDVRLLGVRQGAFCERTDWAGRGGTALAPLGQVVYTVEGGTPRPPFALDGVPLLARSLGTWIRGADAGVRYELVNTDGRPRAHVREGVRGLGASFGAGFARDLALRGAAPDTVVTLRLVAPGDGRLVELVETRGRAPRRWAVVEREDGLVELRGFPAGVAHEGGPDDGRLALVLLLGAEVLELELATLVAPQWSDAERAALTEVASR